MKVIVVACLAIILATPSCERTKKAPAGASAPTKPGVRLGLWISDFKQDDQGQLVAEVWVSNESDFPVMMELDQFTSIGYSVEGLVEERKDIEWDDVHMLGWMAGGGWGRPSLYHSAPTYAVMERGSTKDSIMDSACFRQELVIAEKEPHELAKKVLQRTGKPVKARFTVGVLTLKRCRAIDGPDASAILDGELDCHEIMAEFNIPPDGGTEKGMHKIGDTDNP